MFEKAAYGTLQGAVVDAGIEGGNRSRKPVRLYALIGASENLVKAENP